MDCLWAENLCERLFKMMTFVTLAALALAFIVFLNALNLPSPKKPAASLQTAPPTVNAGKALRMKGPERPRICPVCGTPLGVDEYLIAAIFPDPGPNQKRQAHIYGCAHCYVTGGVNLTRIHPDTLVEHSHVSSS